MVDAIHASGETVYTEPGFIPLFYDDDDRDEEKGTIIAGGSGLTKFLRGTLMGRVGTTANWTMALGAAADGSQTPRAVLAHDCDFSAGPVEGIVYRSGEYNSQAIILGTGIVLDVATRDALRVLGIVFYAGINP